MIRRPPRSTRTAHSFPTRRSSDLNAREAHGRKLAETSSQARLLQGLAETFGLSQAPRRIEIYDNSHIMGTNAVGGMVVAGAEGFVKSQYRKLNNKIGRESCRERVCQ